MITHPLPPFRGRFLFLLPEREPKIPSWEGNTRLCRKKPTPEREPPFVHGCSSTDNSTDAVMACTPERWSDTFQGSVFIVPPMRLMRQRMGADVGIPFLGKGLLGIPDCGEK